jgi:hypothetical protein
VLHGEVPGLANKKFFMHLHNPFFLIYFVAPTQKMNSVLNISNKACYQQKRDKRVEYARPELMV